MGYRDDIKSKPGAPNAQKWNKKTKLDVPPDKSDMRKKMSESAKSLWKKRKEEGWQRRQEQRA